MEVKIESVAMPKHIPWDMVVAGSELHTDMMRNRIELTVSSLGGEVSFVLLEEEIVDFCNSNNIWLFCIRFNLSDDPTKGTFVIYFENHEDLARFAKDKLVNFKLSF